MSPRKRREDEQYGKCPVDAQLTDQAISRTIANELLCRDEYGVGVGDPQIGWWSVNWVNSPAMEPGPLCKEEQDQETRRPPSK